MLSGIRRGNVGSAIRTGETALGMRWPYKLATRITQLKRRVDVAIDLKVNVN